MLERAVHSARNFRIPDSCLSSTLEKQCLQMLAAPAYDMHVYIYIYGMI